MVDLSQSVSEVILPVGVKLTANLGTGIDKKFVDNTAKSAHYL